MPRERQREILITTITMLHQQEFQEIHTELLHREGLLETHTLLTLMQLPLPGVIPLPQRQHLLEIPITTTRITQHQHLPALLPQLQTHMRERLQRRQILTPPLEQILMLALTLMEDLKHLQRVLPIPEPLLKIHMLWIHMPEIRISEQQPTLTQLIPMRAHQLPQQLHQHPQSVTHMLGLPRRWQIHTAEQQILMLVLLLLILMQDQLQRLILTLDQLQHLTLMLQFSFTQIYFLTSPNYWR